MVWQVAHAGFYFGLWGAIALTISLLTLPYFRNSETLPQIDTIDEFWSDAMTIRMTENLNITPRFCFFPVDDQGAIANICNASKLQPRWADALNEVCSLCSEKYANVHGVYVRGSVALGNAIDDASDMDCIVVFDDPVGVPQDYLEWTSAVEQTILNKYPFITAVELYGLSKSEVLNCPRTVFFLKSQSQCVWGEDLIKTLPTAVLSPNAYVHAPRFVSELDFVTDIFAAAPDDVDLISLSKKFSKRMLRTGFELVMFELQVYTRELYLCYKVCTKKWPQFDGLWLDLLSFSIYGTNDIKRYSRVLETLGRFIAALVLRREDIPDLPDCFIDDFGDISKPTANTDDDDETIVDYCPRYALRKLEQYKLDNDFEVVTAPLAIKLDANETTVSDRDTQLEVSLPARLLEQYPDPDAKQLKSAISSTIDIAEEMIVLGNGSDELINNIMLAFFGKRMMLVDVGYPVYSHLARIYEMQTKLIHLTDNFGLPSNVLEQFQSYSPEIVFFSFPNNPTGSLFDEDVVRNLIASFPNTVFVIDEAYFEFSGVTLIDLVTSNRNVIVLRTLSKAYSLAGLRLGYAVCSSSLMSMLQKVALPYNISSVSQHLGLQYFGERQPHIYDVASKTTELRERVAIHLADHPALTIYPSKANFLFIKLSQHIEADALAERLVENSVFLRFMSFGERGQFIRLSLSLEHDVKDAIDQLLMALDEQNIFAEAGGN